MPGPVATGSGSVSWALEAAKRLGVRGDLVTGVNGKDGKHQRFERGQVRQQSSGNKATVVWHEALSLSLSLFSLVGKM